ncbi:hypothetical protein GCM10010329_78530 [Streptomyces spiroverticillatus]|uniref:HTH tetR-type domain-containing protein n=1 Tax=Streptomyces finlayi TaxID=67296 RepID=A0A918X805_9ACTN|nr:TetR/AcrR family transcriptional regulator [Streptomyces finlayi]GHA44018.1 hypothetical protein GCM10010329_78530 [Streptomyces spiroverticillatus]GHD17573.1 hypothetical protein GCM10010334_79520 [Streptomyces finlayi]
MLTPKVPDARRARAQLTRQRILDAAMTLFAEHGYEATTIASIAREAGVAAQTVYFAFGNKQRLLTDLINLYLPCDDALGSRDTDDWTNEVLAAGDVRQQLRHLAHRTRTLNESAAPLLEVLRNAAVTQDDGQDMWQSNKNRRRFLQSRFVDALTDKGPLPDGLTHERAVDICYALLGPELYHLLVSERNWTQDQWEDWAYEGLYRHLTDNGH